MVNRSNAEGHKERFTWLKGRVPPEELHAKFVGGGLKNVHNTGYTEREIISKYKDLNGASVIDVGCGIGRLTRYLLPIGIKAYLGTDVVPEILAEAQQLANGREEYRFELVSGPTIPADPKTADIVCGFSVVTHLLDEEVFRLFQHARRALRPGGVAIFSYLSFVTHRQMFIKNDKAYEAKPDILKFFWPGTLEQFAEDAKLDVVDVVEADTDLPGRGGTLLNGEPAPEKLKLGQSFIVMSRSVE